MRGCSKSVVFLSAVIYFVLGMFFLASAQTVPYTSDVYSIFVHPLIVHPEKAFTGENRQFMDNWFITADEFKALLPELYKRGFILIKPSDIYTYNTQTKKVEKKTLFLPPGKRPLLFSADDLNYYETMKKGGTNLRLIIDENGSLAAEFVQKDGTRIVSTKTEFCFILDDFVAQHPDFSWNGAKGVIAPTGYYGVFGYETQKINESDYTKNLEEAKRIADALKKNGWEFASHGYAHLDSAKASAQELQKDCELWNKTVSPIVGNTNIFIYPKGSEPADKPENLQVLLNAGFTFFYGVGEGVRSKWAKEYVIVRRRQIDGIYFRSKEAQQSPFFDLTKITDRYTKTP